jgi:hypothetical protein
MLETGARTYAFHGHAIVSVDDRIAAASGQTPPSLRNDTDWQRFQAALDRAVVTALGRLAHEANPNPKGRNRLVLSSSARGLERRADAWWWNPAEASLANALGAAAPASGIVAVPGGMRVFDYFLGVGFDEFHLARVAGAWIPDGIPVFSAVHDGKSASAILADHGLTRQPTEMLDPEAGVSLTVWRRAAQSEPPA